MGWLSHRLLGFPESKQWIACGDCLNSRHHGSYSTRLHQPAIGFLILDSLSLWGRGTGISRTRLQWIGDLFVQFIRAKRKPSTVHAPIPGAKIEGVASLRLYPISSFMKS
jgi:hypothetical protein